MDSQPTKIPTGFRRRRFRDSGANPGTSFDRNVGRKLCLATDTVDVDAASVRLSKYPAQLALPVASDLEELPGQTNCVFLRLCLQYGEPADHLFRFGERSVSHRQLAAGAADPRAQRAWQAAFGRDQPTRLHAFFKQLLHRRDELGTLRSVPFCGLVDRVISHVMT